MKRETTPESGFTMLEVLVAMTILAIGLLGIAALQITAIQGSSYSMKLSQTNSIVTNELENLRLKSSASFGDIKTEKKQEGPYQIETTVKEGPTPKTKDILLTITWTDDTGKRHRSVQYRTFISEH